MFLLRNYAFFVYIQNTKLIHSPSLVRRLISLYFGTRKLRTLWLSGRLMKSRGDVWPVTVGLTDDGDS